MLFELPEVHSPSVFLPRIKSIRTCPRKDLIDAIARLREIYIHPQVRGTTRRRFQRLLTEPSLAQHNIKVGNHDLALVGADPFERSFAIQWLTRFISIVAEGTFESEDGVAYEVDVLEQAASLLAVCAGAAASGSVERVFAFPLTSPHSRVHSQGGPVVLPLSHERKMALKDCGGYMETNDIDEIRVVLHDAPLESADFSSVGAQTWGGSCVLAEMIVESPANFGIYGDTLSEGVEPRKMHSPFKVLELGAGTGLASLVLAKVLKQMRPLDSNLSKVLGPTDWSTHQSRPDVVVATDFHPSVLANLRGNIETNFPKDMEGVSSLLLQSAKPDHSIPLSSSPQVLALPLDWSLIHEFPLARNHTVTSVTSVAAPHNPGADSQRPTVTTIDATRFSPLLDMTYDLIIGADIIYEESHARWIRSCVERFLRKSDTPPLRSPSQLATPSPERSAMAHISEIPVDSALFHLIVPLRRTHYLESRTVEEIFSRASDILTARDMTNPTASEFGDNEAAYQGPPSYRAPELAIVSQEDIVCDAYLDTEGKEEVIYRYYKIGWV